MIPGPLFTLPMLLLLLAPLVAAGLSLWLLLRGLFWWLRHRHTPASERPPFWHWPVVVVAILALAGDLWGLVLARKLVQIEEAVTLRAHYRESRQRFVLPEDSEPELIEALHEQVRQQHGKHERQAQQQRGHPAATAARQQQPEHTEHRRDQRPAIGLRQPPQRQLTARGMAEQPPARFKAPCRQLPGPGQAWRQA